MFSEGKVEEVKDKQFCFFETFNQLKIEDHWKKETDLDAQILLCFITAPQIEDGMYYHRFL